MNNKEWQKVIDAMKDHTRHIEKQLEQLDKKARKMNALTRLLKN